MSPDLCAEEFKAALAPLLKAAGFRKSNATWRKNLGASTAVLNVQKSSWGGGTFYINLGVYFHSLGSEANPTENRCHIQRRLDPPPVPSETVIRAEQWFGDRATIEQARMLAESDAKNGLVFKEVRSAAAT